MNVRGPAPRGTSPGRSSDLALRLGSSLVLIPVALAAAWWGGFPAYVLAAIVSLLVFVEWAHIVGASRTLMPDRASVGVAAGLVVLAALAAGLVGAAAGLAIGLLGAVAALALSRSSWLVLGSLYAGLFGVALAAIRRDASLGLEAIVVLLVVVWASDSCAYFAGRSLGGPKLWPRVSPKKTWSGAIGGLAGGVALAALAAKWMGVPAGMGLVVLLIMLSLASQAGDLFESSIKRRFGKKDSSTIIPGHGGVMDRVDGLIFASLLALVVGWVHAGPEAIGRGVLLW